MYFWNWKHSENVNGITFSCVHCNKPNVMTARLRTSLSCASFLMFCVHEWRSQTEILLPSWWMMARRRPPPAGKHTLNSTIYPGLRKRDCERYFCWFWAHSFSWMAFSRVFSFWNVHFVDCGHWKVQRHIFFIGGVDILLREHIFSAGSSLQKVTFLSLAWETFNQNKLLEKNVCRHLMNQSIVACVSLFVKKELSCFKKLPRHIYEFAIKKQQIYE